MVSMTEFNEHFEKICNELEVQPTLLIGDDFKEYITSPLGVYVWWNEEDAVVLSTKADIQTLAHEIRHSWQYKNQSVHNFKFSKKLSWLARLLTSMNFSRLELDAYRYAIKYCKKNGIGCARSRLSALSPVLIVFGASTIVIEIFWAVHVIGGVLTV